LLDAHRALVPTAGRHRNQLRPCQRVADVALLVAGAMPSVSGSTTSARGASDIALAFISE
jgi:hypothetical protein